MALFKQSSFRNEHPDMFLYGVKSYSYPEDIFYLLTVTMYVCTFVRTYGRERERRRVLRE